MSLVFLSDSILTTVQDTGRVGFRARGVNPNGAMDAKAARLINILLGNDEREAVIEIHFPAPRILFRKAAVIALGGANYAAHINDRGIESWRPFLINENQVLSFRRRISGNRLYLSVRGGLEIDAWLESKSTNLKAAIGGFRGRRLLKNDEINFSAECEARGAKLDYSLAPRLIPNYSHSPTIRVIGGAEWENLTEDSRNAFLSEEFTISVNSDRMGFRLNGAPLHSSEKIELISSAVSFGTIQLLPDGQLIILMADHQTTGGYPRIAHVCAHDLPLIAQLAALDRLSFDLISIEEAENLVIADERKLSRLKTAVKFNEGLDLT